jgi:hypothetical protein
MVPCIRLGHYSSTHHNANQSYDLGNPFSDIDLNISSKTKKKNVMPRYRKKKYFTNRYSLKLHSDVFIFKLLHCNSTDYHTTNNQIH